MGEKEEARHPLGCSFAFAALVYDSKEHPYYWVELGATGRILVAAAEEGLAVDELAIVVVVVGDAAVVVSVLQISFEPRYRV